MQSIADLDPFRECNQFFRERINYAFLHNDPAGSGTSLSGQTEPGGGDEPRGQV